MYSSSLEMLSKASMLEWNEFEMIIQRTIHDIHNNDRFLMQMYFLGSTHDQIVPIDYLHNAMIYILKDVQYMKCHCKCVSRIWFSRTIQRNLLTPSTVFICYIQCDGMPKINQVVDLSLLFNPTLYLFIIRFSNKFYWATRELNFRNFTPVTSAGC